MSELKGSREAASHDKNHQKAANMSWYCEAERELLHIRRAIGLLEQAQHAFINKSSVNDPAYWRVKLNKLRTQSMRNKVLELQVDELLARLALIQDPHCRK
ncbi:TPA: hypothetical protein ACU967_004584 [Burkholderia contaminans]|uniref:Uncharacterized protein n=3 Tax=Bacteria TaxID=2 RepID=A0AAP4R8I4_9BURK|nr:hypothetical protein [Burkholderia contaminans]MCA7875855.1 hypothetical protein [Burkholderia contaminans]MDN7569382.1 hypothetical protein [Burkholderia contaminans]MDN8021535.1 hypothetical protein [Burkholderia contaminans]UXZ66047.1 hypothetical protein NUJ29_12430 [Burkholderia contaminans]UXZ73806.1 hypothetical protein NUJ30_12425 [Burkholderia contaminans]